MHHHKTVRKFGRQADQRVALLRSLVEALVLKESIVTTESKAKELKKIIEPLITKAKSGTLAARRLILSRLGNRERVAKKIMDVLALRYKDRKGGYTRVTKVFIKSSDARKSALIELV